MSTPNREIMEWIVALFGYAGKHVQKIEHEIHMPSDLSRLPIVLITNAQQENAKSRNETFWVGGLINGLY